LARRSPYNSYGFLTGPDRHRIAIASRTEVVRIIGV
jgi:hypothetical protein